MTKSQARAFFKQLPAAQKALSIDENRAVAAVIAATPEFQKAGRVALFFPRPWEPDLLALWQLRPQAVVFPRVDEHGTALEFFGVASLAAATPGYAGILEPARQPTSCVFSAGDLLLVPGQIFDARGGRVGSGKGFYDRFLATLAGISVHIWGVCGQAFLAKDTLEQDPTDVRMGAVVTRAGILRVSV